MRGDFSRLLIGCKGVQFVGYQHFGIKLSKIMCACQSLLIILYIRSMKKEMFDTIDGKILRCFEIVKKVGQGAYGQVWKVKDKKTASFCALKKIYDAFRNSTDAQRAYREIKYLQKLSHPNIIKILSFFRPENSRDIYIALQFMEADLSAAIQNNVLKEIHKHFIFFQIANAVHYLHSAHLIHRDLKPSNILVNQNCEVKLCDFGLIRSLAPSEAHQKVVLTENIATRWYRAPEILLCSNSYGKQIDIWSLGCVLAEIFLGRPIFQGTSAISQLERIFEVTGKPTREQLDFVKSEASRSIVESMTVTKKRSIAELFFRADKQLIDLLEKIFQINPKKRIKIEEIVKHPFVNRFKGRGEDKKTNEPIKIMYESQLLTVQEYKHLLYSELEEKSDPSELNTGKTSELSTFYESSITHSLPNNSRQQFFTNNCPLGRPDRISPEKHNFDSKFLPLPSFQSSYDYHKEETTSNIKQKKKAEISTTCNELKVPHRAYFPFESQNNLRLKRDRSDEKRIFKTPEINKTYTPYKMKDCSPINIHHSNQKKPIMSRHCDYSQLKTPARLHQPLLKMMHDMLDPAKGAVRSKRLSPNPKKMEYQTSTDFHPKRTIGGREQLKKDKNVPKFILQGRKKFRSGSPHQFLQSKPNEDMILKKQKTISYLQPVNSSFRRKPPINPRQSQQNIQFQNHILSPQHRHIPRNNIASFNALK